jgi:Transglycosylase-like domain
MRTRIALVAIIPVALITVSILTLTASAQSARAIAPSPTTATSTTPVALPPSALAAYHGPRSLSPVLTGTSLLLHLNPALQAEAALHAAVLQHNADADAAATAAAAAAATAAAVPAGPVDTVTPEQRAAWERVAMCEEGGNWSADGGRFSGGLGISRANWIAYGGTEFAPEGAMATEDQQIMVAERIQSTAPDQYGCHGW